MTCQDYQWRLWHWGENVRRLITPSAPDYSSWVLPFGFKGRSGSHEEADYISERSLGALWSCSQCESPRLLSRGAGQEVKGVGLVLIHRTLKQQPHPPSHRFRNHSCLFQSALCRTSYRGESGGIFMVNCPIISGKVACDFSSDVDSSFPNNWSTVTMSSAVHQRAHADLHSSQSTLCFLARMGSFLPLALLDYVFGL